MRVLVTGGRDFQDYEALSDVLHNLRPRVCTIIHGGARGADSLASRWANETIGVNEVVFPARWNEEGKAAGPIRNTRMLEDGKPDLCVACPGGRGTADMVEKCERAGVTVVRLRQEVGK